MIKILHSERQETTVAERQPIRYVIELWSEITIGFIAFLEDAATKKVIIVSPKDVRILDVKTYSDIHRMIKARYLRDIGLEK